MLKLLYEINFQLDSGTSCNILPSSDIPNMPPLMPISYTLKMYNKSTIRPLGKTQGGGPEIKKNDLIKIYIYVSASAS